MISASMLLLCIFSISSVNKLFICISYVILILMNWALYLINTLICRELVLHRDFFFEKFIMKGNLYTEDVMM